jgi:penicillin-binding protein 1A
MMRIRKWPRKIIACLVVLLTLPLVAVGISLISFNVIASSISLPAEKPQPDSGTSTVYAADGSVIGEFKGADTRVIVPSDQISNNMKIAAVASEDHNFYKHSGVDWTSVLRAFWNDLNNKSLEEGGSTITQQLAKNVYTDGRRTIDRKISEAEISAKLEKTYSKDEILTKYLNTVYMGDSVYGAEAASQSYFRKPAKDLTLSEAALLAGVLPAPSQYSPRSHPAEAESRRNEVLNRVEKYKFASKTDVDAARAEKPVIFPPPDVNGRYPYFLDYVRTYLLTVKGYDPELIYTGGLKIYTSLDPRLEDKAQETLKKTLPNLKDPEAALVSVEPSTGFVRALVGGTDWATSKVNMALGKLGGGSGRQAGSAFKPFVLARAYEAGVSPLKVYPAPPTVQPPGFEKPVGNYEGESFGTATLNDAIAHSINTVFVQLIVDVGVRQTGELANRLGITSIDLSKPVYGSIAIGSYEVSPLDMASAYGVFADSGLRVTPTPVIKITQEDRVIEDNTNRVPVRVLDENVANNVTQSLTGVVLRGTGVAAGIGRPVAGKTGTSEMHQNAWFVGYTPQLSTAIWVGYKEGNISLYGIHGVGAVTGGTWPARMWHEYMAEAMKGVPVVGFPAPKK